MASPLFATNCSSVYVRCFSISTGVLLLLLCLCGCLVIASPSLWASSPLLVNNSCYVSTSSAMARAWDAFASIFDLLFNKRMIRGRVRVMCYPMVPYMVLEVHCNGLSTCSSTDDFERRFDTSSSSRVSMFRSWTAPSIWRMQGRLLGSSPLVVALLGMLVYKFYGEELREMFGYEQHPYGFYLLAVLAVLLVGLLYGFFIAIICGQKISDRHYHVLAKQELTKEYVVESCNENEEPPELDSVHITELRMLGLY